MNIFNFDIGETVKLLHSDEGGSIIARAEYQTAENCYLIRYCARDGRQVESWWGESALTQPAGS